ncbi:MAG: RodZ domain-containing protein [Chloroflexota bacterium]
MSDLGELLRRARAYKGVTLRDAERTTRISRNYLAALEAHDFDQLPARTYTRGIVRNYAQYLGLDPAVVLNLYEQTAQEVDEEDEDFEVTPAVQPIEIRGHWAPNFAIIAFMLVISAVTFTWIYSAYLQPSEDSLPPTISQPTATEVEEGLLDLVAQTPSPDEGSAEGDGSDSATADDTTTDSSDSDGGDAESEGETTQADDGEANAVEETAVPEVEPTDGETQAEEGDTGESGESEGAVDEGEVADVEGVPDTIPDGIAIPPGYHVFAVYAEEEVWVQVTLDGGEVVFNDVLQAGDSTELYVSQTATVTSGNAAYARVFMDGEDMGTLGEPWDAVVTYP